MNTATAMVGAVTAAVTAAAMWTVNRAQARALRHRLGVDIRESQAKDLAAESEARAALATTAKQIAESAYQLADRLQADLERLRSQSAQEMLAAAAQIDTLRRRLVTMQEEIDDLRRRVPA